MNITLNNIYLEQIQRDDLIAKVIYKNTFELPKINRITIDYSGSSIDTQLLLQHLLAIEISTLQKPLLIKSKRSEAVFKLREGQYFGAKVTLRRNKLINFLKILISQVLVRNQDLSLINTNIYGARPFKPNISFGINDMSLFPQVEYEYDLIKSRCGANITIHTSCTDNSELITLLSSIQLPINPRL